MIPCASPKGASITWLIVRYVLDCLPHRHGDTEQTDNEPARPCNVKMGAVMVSDNGRVELIGGPFDGLSCMVVQGQRFVQIPFDRRRSKANASDNGWAASGVHRYELQLDGRCIYAGIVENEKR
jgi:hypothetical protein